MGFGNGGTRRCWGDGTEDAQQRNSPGGRVGPPTFTARLGPTTGDDRIDVTDIFYTQSLNTYLFLILFEEVSEHQGHLLPLVFWGSDPAHLLAALTKPIHV